MKICTCLTIVCFFAITACKKHAVAPINQLPAETQNGANTFSCLVNGKVFKPGGISLTSTLGCFYQNLYNTNNPGYFFGLYGVDHRNPEDYPTVGIYLDSVQIKDTGVISLAQHDTKGKGYGEYGHYIREGTNITIYYTNEALKGELNIKHFDSLRQVISGTFWFNAISNKGDTIKITNGRFDMHYTR